MAYAVKFLETLNKMYAHRDELTDMKIFDSALKIAVIGKRQKVFEEFVARTGNHNSLSLHAKNRFIFVDSIEQVHSRRGVEFDAVVYLQDADQLAVRTLWFIWCEIDRKGIQHQFFL